jgi:hypothetical protein
MDTPQTRELTETMRPQDPHGDGTGLAGTRGFDHAKTTASSAKRQMNFTTCELDYAAFGSKESDFWGELDELSERQEVV